MKLIICQYCNQPMLRSFTYCPRCGMTSRVSTGPLWIMGVVALFVIGLFVTYLLVV